MKTKITYLFLLLMTMVLGLQSCKADKVDGAVCGMEPVKRPILVYLIKCIRQPD